MPREISSSSGERVRPPAGDNRTPAGDNRTSAGDSRTTYYDLYSANRQKPGQTLDQHIQRHKKEFVHEASKFAGEKIREYFGKK